MRPFKATKRVWEDADVSESFWEPNDESGAYVIVKLTSGKAFKGRGWPWVQAGVRGILGGSEKVAKANFLGNGDLLLKTKNDTQTNKLLKAVMFGGEACEVRKDARLNVSKGTIHAYDMIDLPEDEVVGWLSEFGVVGAKRITRKVGDHTENTPTIILTFDRPSCPTRLVFDYVSYPVRKYVPNPLICHRCGTYGHVELKCTGQEVCLTCGKARHDGTCSPKCINCHQEGHSCLSRQCSVWQKEKQICTIKVEQDVSYAHARRLYVKANQTPTAPTYSAVLRSQSERQQAVSLGDRVDNLEKKMNQMLNMLDHLMTELGKGKRQGSGTPQCTDQDEERDESPLIPSPITDTPLPAHDVSDDDASNSRPHQHLPSNREECVEVEDDTQDVMSLEVGRTSNVWTTVGRKTGEALTTSKGKGKLGVPSTSGVGGKPRKYAGKDGGRPMPHLTRMDDT